MSTSVVPVKDQMDYAEALREEAEAIRRGDMETVSAADVAAELGLQERP
ncbi:hypothetical protein [uncultured Tessaracoccus sp.]|nr:hypothetical protein [uncultured Tessaracoccus sp.]